MTLKSEKGEATNRLLPHAVATPPSISSVLNGKERLNMAVEMLYLTFGFGAGVWLGEILWNRPPITIERRVYILPDHTTTTEENEFRQECGLPVG